MNLTHEKDVHYWKEILWDWVLETQEQVDTYRMVKRS